MVGYWLYNCGSSIIINNSVPQKNMKPHKLGFKEKQTVNNDLISGRWTPKY